jgi:hypothetical protein
MTHTSSTWQNFSSPFVIPHTFSSTKSPLILVGDFILLYQKKKIKEAIIENLQGGKEGKKRGADLRPLHTLLWRWFGI